MTFTFRTLEGAQACLAAFPEFGLADGVGEVTYYSPGRGGRLEWVVQAGG